MTSRASGDLVALRAALVGALSLLFATLAHMTAGGRLPASWTLGVMLGLCAVAAGLVLDRQASRLRLGLLLVSGQATVHFAMTALAGHGDHGPSATTVGGALTDAVHHVAADAVTDAPMTLTHLVAAALTGAVLGHAERALWAVLRLVARAARFVALALALATTPPLTPTPRCPRTTADPAPRRTALVVVTTHVRRGPPLLLLAS